jgi:hypothetical protein
MNELARSELLVAGPQEPRRWAAARADYNPVRPSTFDDTGTAGALQPGLTCDSHYSRRKLQEAISVADMFRGAAGRF